MTNKEELIKLKASLQNNSNDLSAIEKYVDSIYVAYGMNPNMLNYKEKMQIGYDHLRVGRMVYPEIGISKEMLIIVLKEFT